MAITNNHIFFSNTNTSDDPLNYPSITCINKHMTNMIFLLHFNLPQKNQISNLIKHLNDKKNSTIYDL